MTRPTPARWRVVEYTVLVCTVENESIAAADTPEIAAQIVREHNALVDLLDLAERNVPTFQILGEIREALGLPPTLQSLGLEPRAEGEHE